MGLEYTLSVVVNKKLSAVWKTVGDATNPVTVFYLSDLGINKPVEKVHSMSDLVLFSMVAGIDLLCVVAFGLV